MKALIVICLLVFLGLSLAFYLVYNLGMAQRLIFAIREDRLIAVLPSQGNQFKIVDIKWYVMIKGETVEVSALEGLANKRSVGIVVLKENK